MNELVANTITVTIKGLGHLLCKIDAREIEKVPQNGPLILVTNHVNFLDVPVIYTHLLPRNVTGFVKSETWNNPLMASLFNMWGAIPIQRGSADMNAINLGLQALSENKIVAIAPEGTRSGDGRLRHGHPGVVSLAIHSGAPILPLVFYGSETIHKNVRRLRRTEFRIRVGNCFMIDLKDEKLDRATRRKITDEIMFELANLLPQPYRGVYNLPGQPSSRFLTYLG